MAFKLGYINFEVKVATSTRSKWSPSFTFFTKGFMGVAFFLFKINPRVLLLCGTSRVPQVSSLFLKELAKLGFEVLDLGL